MQQNLTTVPADSKLKKIVLRAIKDTHIPARHLVNISIESDYEGDVFIKPSTRNHDGSEI